MSNREPSDDELPEDSRGDAQPPDDVLTEPEEDASEEEDAPEEEDVPAEAVTAERGDTRRSKIGLVMFASAGALWGLFGMMRCDADQATQPPSAAVSDQGSQDAPNLPSVTDDAEPADAPALEGAPVPQPAAETPDLDPLDPSRETPAEGAPLGGFDPRPQAAAWARSFKPPSTVKYTVRRGGSLENVANLYKIFHHEISELNPGVPLKRDLPPKSGIVVYKAKDGAKSASVGLPSNGTLEGGVPMMDGPGRVMKMIGWKSFGTATTVALLDTVLRHWAETGHSQPVIVGNMSSRNGGRLSPHSTHQSGRDVDLGYPQILPSGEELNWRVMDSKNLDGKETWALLSMLVQTGQVEVIYIDRGVQKLLHAYALEHGLMSKNALKGWMEYPAPTGAGSPVIQHVKGHVDHMHVRFKCQPHETACKSRQR